MENKNLKKVLKRTNHVQRLTEDQKSQPELVYNLFFNDLTVDGIREELLEWLQCAMANETCYYQDGIQRSNLIFLYVRLELLVEASYILFMKNGWYKEKYEALAKEGVAGIKYL